MSLDARKKLYIGCVILLPAAIRHGMAVRVHGDGEQHGGNLYYVKFSFITNAFQGARNEIFYSSPCISCSTCREQCLLPNTHDNEQ